jgi:hypothetical protein
MANEEKIYECEVKKLFMRGGVKRWEWVISSVADAIATAPVSSGARTATAR